VGPSTPVPVASRLSARPWPAWVVLVAAVGCHRPHDEPAPLPSAPAPQGAALLGVDDRPHGIGELAHAHDYTMSVESVKDCPMDAPFAPRRGFVKVGLEVSLAGTSALEVPVNPFYATLVDATGEAYSSTLAGCAPGLPSVRLVQGQSARGFVTFEIPKAARKLQLRYAPVVIGPGIEELKFVVNR
jgi:hypothetical protein